MPSPSRALTTGSRPDKADASATPRSDGNALANPNRKKRRERDERSSQIHIASFQRFKGVDTLVAMGRTSQGNLIDTDEIRPQAYDVR